MKLKMLGMLTGLALLLPSTGALAHTDVYVGLGLGFVPPPAVVIEARPVYYPPRVYYRDYAWYPRPYYAPRVRYWHDRDWDDRRGRGHHERRHHDDD